MVGFGIKWRFGLVKNTQQDTSFIQLVIPDVMVKFLQEEGCINLESEDVHYFHDEEVAAIVDFLTIVKPLDAYRNKVHLLKADLSEEDVGEICEHLLHLCQMALNGQKVLYVMKGWDTAFIEEG